MIHILSLCEVHGKDGIGRLKRHVTSLAELKLLPRQIEKFKERFAVMGRKWYKEVKMAKESERVEMNNAKLGYGWFQDTAIDNLFLCCRFIKNNADSDLCASLTSEQIEQAR